MAISTEELLRRFTYHSPTADQVPKYQELRKLAFEFACRIVELTPPSREQSSALTRLEESVMHANAAIARRSHLEGPGA